MLMLLNYLVNHEYLPPIAVLFYLLIGMTLAMLAVKAAGWRYIRGNGSIFRPVATMCIIVAEWPLIVLGFFVFVCIVEWEKRG